MYSVGMSGIRDETLAVSPDSNKINGLFREILSDKAMIKCWVGNPIMILNDKSLFATSIM